MPRKGRRAEAAKSRWRKVDLSLDIDTQLSPVTDFSNQTPTTPAVLQLCGPICPEDLLCPSTDFQSGHGTGRRHRVRRWPISAITGRSHKLIVPEASLEKKFALLVGDSHLRGIVDGFVSMPEGDLSYGVMSTPGACAADLRHEILHAVLPRTPDVVVLLAPSNNLTASRTIGTAADDFRKLLTAVHERWGNVVVLDFPPRLNVEVAQQEFLRQEFQRVAAREGVQYVPISEHFPCRRLDLWCKDGIHLSDSVGMQILVQLLSEAAIQQLESMTSKVLASHSPSPPARRPTRPVSPRVVVKGEAIFQSSSNPFDWSVVKQKGDLVDCSIPVNPVQFSPDTFTAAPSPVKHPPAPTSKKKTAAYDDQRWRRTKRTRDKHTVVEDTPIEKKKTSLPARDQHPDSEPPVMEEVTVPLSDIIVVDSCLDLVEDTTIKEKKTSLPAHHQRPDSEPAVTEEVAIPVSDVIVVDSCLDLVEDTTIKEKKTSLPAHHQRPDSEPAVTEEVAIPVSDVIVVDSCLDLVEDTTIKEKKTSLPAHHQRPDSEPAVTEEVAIPVSDVIVVDSYLDLDVASGRSINGPHMLSVRATHSQGDRRFGSDSRGVQCTCMALTFLAYHNEGLHIDTALLDRVLTRGDELYIAVVEQHKIDGTFRHILLTVEEMPKQVLTDDHFYDVVTSDVRVGPLRPQEGNPRRVMCMPLATILQCLSEEISHAVLLVTPECIAVFWDPSGWYGLFDSHSRCSKGLPHPNGKAIMCTFWDLGHMVRHLHTLLKERNPRATYEFVPVLFNRVAIEGPCVSDTSGINVSPSSTTAIVREPAMIPLEQVSSVRDRSRVEKHRRKKIGRRENVDVKTSHPLQRIKRQQSKRNEYFRKMYEINLEYRDKKKKYVFNRYKSDLTFRIKQKKLMQDRYMIDPVVQNKKKKFVHDSYRTDPIFRNKQKKLVQDRYRTDPIFRNKQKKFVQDRYSTDPIFRNKQKKFVQDRYRTDPIFRNKQKKFVQDRYSTDPIFRNKQKKLVQDRYSTDPIFRNKQKKFVQDRYSTDPIFRNKQKKFVQDRYSTDPIFRNKQKKLVQDRYSTDPIFRNKQKKLVQDRYRTDPAIQHAKKTRSKKRYRSDPVILSKSNTQKREKYHLHEDVRINKSKKSLENKRKSSLPKTTHQEITQPMVSEKMKAAILSFRNRISFGPTYVCTVCHRTFFPTQVRQCDRSKYRKNPRVAAECLTGKYVHICDDACQAPCSVAPERMQEWICSTCDRHLSRGGKPPIAAANRLHLASIPLELAALNVLERQLIAKIIPFAKIVALPKGQQRAIHGAVVCVPSDVETVINALPRPPTGAALLQVKLKRRITYKGYQHFYTVDMPKVLTALEKLKETNPDYRDVVINESATLDHLLDSQPAEEEPLHSEDANVAIGEETNHVGEEQQALRPGLALDTCMQPPDIAQEYLSYGNGVFSIAPAQGNKPVGFFAVPRLETLAFPVLFPDGKNALDEEREVKLSPSKYFNTRLFSVDTRFAQDQSYLFFAQFVTETHLATNSMSIQSRKGKSKTKDGRRISNKMLQDKEEMEHLINDKEATRFMQPLRGTPAYWDKSLRDLHAMARQLGKPTFFLTFSAAEMRWPEVINIIKAQQGEQGDFSKLDWKAKCEILHSNPVTVMRLFEKRVEALMNELILSPTEPIGPVVDFFYRVEFQARGSPHIHMLVWVKDAPVMENNGEKEVIKFIDRYISCQMPDETVDPELHKIVKEVQIHSRNHSKSCRKRRVECRFGFPKLPMDNTIITEPTTLDIFELADEKLVDEEPSDEKAKGEKPGAKKEVKSQAFLKVQKEAKAKLEPIRDMLLDQKASFQNLSQLLKACNMTFKEYEKYVTDLTCGMVVHMRRSPQDCWINGYNPDLLRAWNANMDIQFVLDDYACIMYMMSYLTKAEHEMTEFLKTVIKEVKKSNVNEKDEMKQIMQAYSKHREVSAQESVARTCSMPLKKCSRQVLFINTDEDGVKMSYPMSRLATMDPNEEDIWISGLPEKYLNRPASPQFEGMCLAEFASEYRVVYSHQTNGPNVIPLLNDMGFIQKRTHGKPAVIRFARFSLVKHPEKYYRRLLKLYLPHRRDADLKGNGSHSTYHEFHLHGYLGKLRVERIIDNNTKRYEGGGKNLDKVLKEIREQGPLLNAWNTFAPEVELDRLECLELQEPLGRPDEEEHDTVPCYQIDEPPSGALPLIAAPKLSPDLVRAMYRSLNETQASVFYTVQDWCYKRVWGSNPEPFFYFVTGGAGCGKSHVIKCVYQEATRILHQLPRFRDRGDMSQPCVLLAAFTGTAAYNISGKTLHSLLKLPKVLKPPYQGLGNSLDNVRAVLSNAEILIIDEISMVSKQLFSYVHWRLQQIKGNNRPFGGMSVLAVGDFYQLPPLGKAKPLCVYEDSVLDLWRENFKLVNLTEIMRQREDVDFAQLLNRLRVKGKTDSLSEQDRTLLANTVADVKDCPLDALHIFATNKEVDQHNASVIATLRNPVINVWAEDNRRDPRTGAMLILKSCIKGKKTELPDKIQVAIGARIMLIRNLDVEDGLVNGTFGTIANIVTNSGEGPMKVQLIGLKLDNPTAGLKKRGKADGLVHIERLEEQMSKRGVVRRQFPMRLAFGCTSHKVQGMTLTSSVVSLKRIFEPGMAYVALSRTTSLEGLKITDFEEKKIYADPQITEALENMSQASFHIAKPLRYFFSSDRPAATLTIVHHNVEGLPRHIEDLKRHHELRLADILCLTETHLSGASLSPDFQLEGYSFFGRNRHVSYSNRVDLAKKEGGGVATYCRSSLQPQELHYLHNVTDLEFTVVKIQLPFTALIATVYRPPTYQLSSFIERIKSLLDALDILNCHPIVICEDFNEDLLSPGKKAINNFFQSRGFTQLISEPTTEKRTLLDHIYVSLPKCNLQSGILHTYYSYHNAVYCVLTL